MGFNRKEGTNLTLTEIMEKWTWRCSNDVATTGCPFKCCHGDVCALPQHELVLLLWLEPARSRLPLRDPSTPERADVLEKTRNGWPKKTSFCKWFHMFPLILPFCRLNEQTCSCCPWRMHLTRVVLLRASLLLLQEVPGLSTWITGPENTSLRIFHSVTRSDTCISYYIRLATYVCPQLCPQCLRFMFPP